MAGIGMAAGAIGGAIAQPIAAHFAQKRQWKYTKKMMQTRHQWEVADLIAAGLNPILGYVGSKGGPPLGSVGIPSIAGGQGTTALSAMKLRSELRLLQSSADKLDAEAAKAGAQTKKVELEVKEFKPTIGGVARRVFDSVRKSPWPKKFLEGVDGVPDWIREKLGNAAKR